MPRIFITPGSIKDDAVSLPEAESKRLLRVLRMRPGDTVTLFDGEREYSAKITSLTPKSAEAKITGKIERNVESPLHVMLGQGMPKAEKLELVV